MEETIKEGKAVIKVPKAGKISSRMPTFYNPVMEMNRTISVLLLDSIAKNDMQIADPLAASGIRSIRFLKELGKNKIKSISINDNDDGFIQKMRKQFRLNKIIPGKKAMISNEDASLFLLKSSGFDYIDIDPFGSPNNFLDAAVKRLARDGILAVTATDTGALCGASPKACLRKYWAMPKRDYLMHETGLRILIRKVQLIGMQHEKALVPIFSYARKHYFRVFLKCVKGKKECDKTAEQHKIWNDAGPMWTGRLWDKALAKKMHELALRRYDDKAMHRFLAIIKEESKIGAVGFYDIHETAERVGLRSVPENKRVLGRIMNAGNKAAFTHFNATGIRAEISRERFAKFVKSSY